jgi:hypothetical protein
MPRYQVAVYETNVFYAEVTADTEEQAKDLVSDQIGEAMEFTDVVGECRSSDVQVAGVEELPDEEDRGYDDPERYETISLFFCVGPGADGFLVGGIETRDNPKDDSLTECKACGGGATEMDGIIILNRDQLEVEKKVSS